MLQLPKTQRQWLRRFIARSLESYMIVLLTRSRYAADQQARAARRGIDQLGSEPEYLDRSRLACILSATCAPFHVT